jgi:hypothetical protein
MLKNGLLTGVALVPFPRVSWPKPADRKRIQMPSCGWPTHWPLRRSAVMPPRRQMFFLSWLARYGAIGINRLDGADLDGVRPPLGDRYDAGIY